MNKPLISILMSCYNAQKWLNESIESVLNQTYKYFEFIIIDDGSNDNTWDIIIIYSKKDCRIIPIKKENTGLTDSLNYGLKIAYGKWVARIDADDYWEKIRLEKQIEYIKKHPEVVLLGTACQAINKNGSFTKKCFYPSSHTILVHNIKYSKKYFPHSSAFINKNALEKVGYYNTFFKKAQDKDLWLRLSNVGKIACIKKCYVKIRKHENQISKNFSGKPQYVYGLAASVAYVIRELEKEDPSVNKDKYLWLNFLEWIEKKSIIDKLPQRNKIWNDARLKYYASNNKIIGLVRFFLEITKLRGQICKLILEKIFGTMLHKSLAHQWIKNNKC